MRPRAVVGPFYHALFRPSFAGTLPGTEVADAFGMKAYCINLDRRPDRMERMGALLAGAGLPFTRVAAVDGQDPAVAAAAAAACGIGMAGRRMSAGAYGCFQSHREVWRLLIASGESHAMVLEDDLVIAPGLAGCLDAAWVPRDADLVRLETSLKRVHCDTAPHLPAPHLPNPHLPAPGRRLQRLRSRHTGTGAYVIAAAAARLLLQTEVFVDPVDEVLFNEASPAFDTLVTYQMVPAPVVQGAKQAPGDPEAPAGWSATSITERFAPGQAVALAPEGSGKRLARRLREELRARRLGTRYAVVPFG